MLAKSTFLMLQLQEAVEDLCLCAAEQELNSWRNRKHFLRICHSCDMWSKQTKQQTKTMTQSKTSVSICTKVFPETTQLYQRAQGQLASCGTQFPSCTQTCPAKLLGLVGVTIVNYSCIIILNMLFIMAIHFYLDIEITRYTE